MFCKIIFLFAFLFSSTLFAQRIQSDGFGNITNLNEAKFVRVVDEINLDYPGSQNERRINYRNIKGSPFWKDEWQDALLYSSQTYVGTLPVRINFASGELYFLRDSEEFVLSDNKIISKILFPGEKDSVVFINNVPNLILNNKPVNGFVQVLNFGKYQLLKYTNRSVASADSNFHTLKRYFFADQITYFIKSNEKADRIKKLNKENVLFYLPASSYDEWIKENSINFKNEQDIIRFLNYYNSR